MVASVLSKAFTQSVSFDYDRNRQYLMFIVEGSATVSFEAGDTLVVEKSYEPLVVPINGFTIRDVVGRVVVVSNASTIQSGKVLREVPYFNGISQYGILPNVNLQTNDVVTFDVISPTSTSAAIRMLLSSDEAYTTLVRINANSADLVTEGGPVTVDGVPSTSLPLDGQQHTLSLTLSRARLLNLVAAQSTGGGSFLRFADAPIFNLRVNDGLVYNFPMDDGWSNNPTMRNVGSGTDGTFVNMTEAAWKELT